jgi:hypothetical protein
MFFYEIIGKSCEKEDFKCFVGGIKYLAKMSKENEEEFK